ncbi:Transposon Polyprotein Reverse transcriptase [Phytophthora palmivora]|uniref:Transposon Polyprotein Reverse transcriptase n=1 Tax=Phytophthora palmivora TaxID=4796 RepID=A0A2P4Y8E7_9STRA|nr:Transposon Polyprotein Reverse transcriptase [Phytophthora palmivora]
MYEVYTDASFACQSKERKSITGYVIKMAGCMKVQKKANGYGTCYRKWVFPKTKPVQVWCDSRSAITIAKNPGNHQASTHIEIKYLYKRDLVEEGRLVVEY